MTDANTNGIWFWIHSLQPAEFLPWGVWQPDGVSGVNENVNFVSMFAGFDYRWTDESPKGAGNAGSYPICQFLL